MIIRPAYCSAYRHWNYLFVFWYKFELYIMQQISCLCSVISWKYIHILQSNLQVTNYCYELNYKFKKFMYAKMLALKAANFSECTYRVCVFCVASGDKIQRNVHWLAGLCDSPCCVSCWTATATDRFMTWSQKRTWNNWHNGPSTGNEQNVGYRLILISLSVPLCDVLSDCLSYVCHCIQKYMYENISF